MAIHELPQIVAGFVEQIIVPWLILLMVLVSLGLAIVVGLIVHIRKRSLAGDAVYEETISRSRS